MGDETTISGIGLSLTLDTAQYDAALERSERRYKKFLTLLGTGAGSKASVPLGAGAGPAGAHYLPGGAQGAQQANVNFYPTFTAGRGAVSQLRSELRRELSSQPIPISVTLGRSRFAEMRREISAGIGAVPIQVTYGGGKGGTMDVVTAIVAKASGISTVTARQQIRSSMAAAGVQPGALERREHGGSVAANRSYLVGERGAERFRPTGSGTIDSADVLRREGGYTRAERGAAPDFYKPLRAAAQRLSPENIAAGKAWYPRAAAYAAQKAEQYGIPVDRARGILAVLSAGTSWESNQTKFERILKAHAEGKDFPYQTIPAPGKKQALDAHVKAEKILKGGDPFKLAAGPKISQFHRGVSGDLSALVLDIWATRTSVAGLPGIPEGMRKGTPPKSGPWREALERDWARAGKEAGLAPAEFQAALWLQEKQESDARKRMSRAGRMQPKGAISMEFAARGLRPTKAQEKAKQLRRAMNPFVLDGDVRRHYRGMDPFSAESSWLTGLDAGDITEPEDTAYADRWDATHRAGGGPTFRQVKPGRFHAAISSASKVVRPSGRRVGETVYVYPEDEYAGMKTFLGAGGTAGYAVKPDGDLVSVFNIGGKGAGQAAVKSALRHGAKKLDAFDEVGSSLSIGPVHPNDRQKNLPKFYAKYGFKEVGRDLWNPDYAPEGWQGAEPDVVYMQRMRGRGRPGQLRLGMAQGGPAKGGGLPRGYRMEFVTPMGGIPATQFMWAGENIPLFGEKIKKQNEIRRATNWTGSATPMVAAVVYDRKGEVAATAPFTIVGADKGPGYLHPEMTRVLHEHWGKGIANAMYVKAEKFTGKEVKPSYDQTQSGKSLWLQKKRPFGKSYDSELREIEDKLLWETHLEGPSQGYRGRVPKHWMHVNPALEEFTPDEQQRVAKMRRRHAAEEREARARVEHERLRLVTGGRWASISARRIGFETDDEIPQRKAGGWAHAYRSTLANMGGTFDAGGHQPKRGYAVGLGQGPIVPEGNPRAFANAYGRILGQAPFVGTWQEGGNIQVDAADVLGRRRSANRLASHEGQISFYDLLRNEEIATRRLRGDPSPGQMKMFERRGKGGPAFDALLRETRSWNDPNARRLGMGPLGYDYLQHANRYMTDNRSQLRDVKDTQPVFPWVHPWSRNASGGPVEKRWPNDVPDERPPRPLPPGPGVCPVCGQLETTPVSVRSKHGLHPVAKGRAGGGLVSALRDTELEHWKMPRETATFLDPDTGKILLQKSGGSNNVFFDDDEILGLAKNHPGSVMTHNHPSGWLWGKGLMGESPDVLEDYIRGSLTPEGLLRPSTGLDSALLGNGLSPDDVRTGLSAKVSEVRATTPAFTYSLRGKHGLLARDNMEHQKLFQASGPADWQTRNELYPRIFSGELTPEAASALHWGKVWDRVASRDDLDVVHQRMLGIGHRATGGPAWNRIFPNAKVDLDKFAKRDQNAMFGAAEHLADRYPLTARELLGIGFDPSTKRATTTQVPGGSTKTATLATAYHSNWNRLYHSEYGPEADLFGGSNTGAPSKLLFQNRAVAHAQVEARVARSRAALRGGDSWFRTALTPYRDTGLVDSSMPGLLTHEFGHAVDFMHSTTPRYKVPDSLVSAYARTNGAENFAELFTAHERGTGHLAGSEERETASFLNLLSEREKYLALPGNSMTYDQRRALGMASGGFATQLKVEGALPRDAERRLYTQILPELESMQADYPWARVNSLRVNPELDALGRWSSKDGEISLLTSMLEDKTIRSNRSRRAYYRHNPRFASAFGYADDDINDDVLHTTRHEFGHAIDTNLMGKLGQPNPSGPRALEALYGENFHHLKALSSYMKLGLTGYKSNVGDWTSYPKEGEAFAEMFRLSRAGLDPYGVQGRIHAEASRRRLSSGGEVGPYIVNENGRELFVPRRLEDQIPPKVMAQIPHRGKGGIAEINQQPWSLFSPPEDGWIIPAHLKGQVPRAAEGRRRWNYRNEAGQFEDRPHATARQRKEDAMSAAVGRFRRLAEELEGTTRAGRPDMPPSDRMEERTAQALHPTSGRASPSTFVGAKALFAFGGGKEVAKAKVDLAEADAAIKNWSTSLRKQVGHTVDPMTHMVERLHETHDAFRASTVELGKNATETKRLGRVYNSVRNDVAALEGEYEKKGKALQVLERPPSGLRGLVALQASFAAFSVAMEAINFGVNSLKPMVERGYDAATGYRVSEGRVTAGLATGLPAAGNLNALFAQRAAGTGISSGLAGSLQSALQDSVAAKAAAKNEEQIRDLVLGAIGSRSGGRTGIGGAYGGVNGGDVFAEQLGGGLGFFQQLGMEFKAGAGAPARGGRAGAYGNQSLVARTPADPFAIDILTARKDSLNDSFTKGAMTYGKADEGVRAFNVGLEDATKTLRDDFVKNLKGTEFEAAAKDWASGGFILKDAAGNAADFGETLRYLSTASKGADIPTYAEFRKGNQNQLDAAKLGNAITQQITSKYQIPYQQGAQLTANPFIAGQATAGYAGPRNAKEAGGFYGKGGAAFSSKIDLGLSTAQAGMDSLQKMSEAWITGTSSMISKEIDSTAGGKFTSYMHEAADYGKQIAGFMQDATKAQAAASRAATINSVRLAARAVSDARGLVGAASGPRNLGANERSQTMLGFNLQQRDINLELATAGFQVAGQSGEERAARQEAAIAAAKIHQRQLNLSEQGFDISSHRAVTDANASLGLIQIAQRAEAEAYKAAQAIAPLQVKQQEKLAQGDALFAQAMGNLQAESGQTVNAVATMGLKAALAGGALKDLVAHGLDLDKVFQSLTLAGGGSITDTRSSSGDQHTGGATYMALTETQKAWEVNNRRNIAGSDPRIGYSAGIVGYAAGRTDITVGEAKGEAVAILRNPRRYNVGAEGGGPISISISIPGVVVRHDNDIVALAQQIEDRLANKLAMLVRR